MIERFVLDLGEERNYTEYNIKYWKYLYVGSCEGDVSIYFNSKRKGNLNPEEFDKITDLEGIEYLIINNTSQPGKELVIYYELKKRRLWIL